MGLAVIVYELVQKHGIEMLGPIVLLVGLLQLVAGLLKWGQYLRAVAPPVTFGMLAGIGVLIFASQFHVAVDDKPRGSGLQNLIAIREAIYKGVFPLDGRSHHLGGLGRDFDDPQHSGPPGTKRRKLYVEDVAVSFARFRGIVTVRWCLALRLGADGLTRTAPLPCRQRPGYLFRR